MISRNKTWFLFVYGEKLDEWETWNKMIKDENSIDVFKNLFENILKDNLIQKTEERRNYNSFVSNPNFETDTFNFKTNLGTNPNYYFNLYSGFRYRFPGREYKFTKYQIKEMLNSYLLLVQEQCSYKHKQVALIYSPMLGEDANIIDQKLIHNELLNCTLGFGSKFRDERDLKINWIYYKTTIRWPHSILERYDNKWTKEYLNNVDKNRKY